MAFATLRHALRAAPIAALSGLLSLLALSGCATPSITIREVTLRDQTAEAVALDVQVELRNPADASMRLLQWDYTFSNASGSYSGTWEALTTLPPGELVTRSVPVVLPAAAGTEQWSISGVLSYRSPSRIAEIAYDLGIWRPRTSFAGSASSAQAASAP
jgi:hypothetical protein